MTLEREEPMTPDESRARDAVRGLARPRAELAFRERLKRDFVAGRVGESRVIALAAPWHRRLVARLALATATLAVLAVSLVVANRGPAWTVLASAGDGIAVVDQVPVPLGHTEELRRRLHPGARITVPEGAEIELASAGHMVVQVTSGTEFTVPPSPGRWFGRVVIGGVRHGEIRLTTGPSFHGAHLRLDTPEAQVEVTGTTLAVICEPVGTCVCVFDGVVRVGDRRTDAEPVTSGHRRFVFNTGKPPESAEIRPTEIQKLADFRDGKRAWLEGETD